MLVIMTEIKGALKSDISINPREVISVSAHEIDEYDNRPRSSIELIGGNSIIVEGSVAEVTKKLNQNKRLLKD